ncbi:TetR/AcrR family transcriptional regulator [Pleomorphovibrio marinus]|uniref:TetR/AcrR family transcriptional regulator n=1 Tax=Pleomorphovibrio marinus TaxID=2164132 RepID=UPI000E0C791B|nr:TetR/AcrR family transcriptional regulator [Pleomorphovibrio marinus]
MDIKVHFPDNPRLFLKNPESSSLGTKIVSEGIRMIKKHGLENFTFKKLADKTGSTEASIYRYFESKHHLLVYLISIYWEVLQIKILFNTQNISEPWVKIDKLIMVITNVLEVAPNIINVNLKDLHEIVICESSKTYLTKKVDEEDKEGFFVSYKKLVFALSEILKEANPHYPYPRALAVNLLETTYEQYYFSNHFGELTELGSERPDSPTVKSFLESLIKAVLIYKEN